MRRINVNNFTYENSSHIDRNRLYQLMAVFHDEINVKNDDIAKEFDLINFQAALNFIFKTINRK